MAKVTKLVGGRKLQIKHGGGGGVFAGIGHKRLHEITSPLDHISAAILGRMLQADANGMPVNATNTDAQVAAAVTASHARQHSITATADHTSTATPGQILKADANGLPVNATNTDAQVADAVSKAHTRDVAEIVGVTIDNGNAVISTGSKGYRVIPYACTVTGWEVLANASGSIVVDVKKCDYAGFPATASIAGTEKPTLAAAQKAQDLTLTTWTAALAAGDILEFVVDSVATVKRVSVTLFVTRT